MKKNIIVKVTAKQFVDYEVIELPSVTTQGFIKPIDGGYLIHYCELDESGYNSTVDLTVGLSDDYTSVSMERSGETFGGLVIIPQKRNVSAYSMGDICFQLGVFGKYVDFDFDGEKGHLFMQYSIDINSVDASENETKIEFYTDCSER